MPPSNPGERWLELAALVQKSPARGRWLVLTHNNPDPDALASALILGRILRRALKRRVTVAYGGLIGRAENRAMFEGLKLGFSHLRHLSFGNYAHFALVDAQPGTGNSQLPEGVVPDLVFDHHPMRRATQAVPFADVRTDYGASATILAEYLEEAGLPIDSTVATAVIYAIRSETRDFGREYSACDKAVYDRYLPHVDKRRLSKIQSADLPVSYFRTLHHALENLESVDTLVVSHLGEIEQPDMVPEVADLLLRMHGKTWSLATGLYEDRIYLSMRTTNPRADAGRLMRRLVGRKGKGGGHGMTAGGWVPRPEAEAGSPRVTPESLARRWATLLKKNPDRLQAIARAAAAE